MGGAASGGLLASIAAGIKTVLGSLFGQDTYTLTQANLPNIVPTFTGTAGTATSTNVNIPVNASSSTTAQAGGSFAPITATIIGSLSSTFTPAGTVSSINGNQAQTTISYKQPSRIMNFIIRIA
jgi:microcystin-dependent protein